MGGGHKRALFGSGSSSAPILTRLGSGPPPRLCPPAGRPLPCCLPCTCTCEAGSVSGGAGVKMQDVGESRQQQSVAVRWVAPAAQPPPPRCQASPPPPGRASRGASAPLSHRSAFYSCTRSIPVSAAGLCEHRSAGWQYAIRFCWSCLFRATARLPYPASAGPYCGPRL